MSWFKRKTKEEKIKILNDKVNQLNKKWSHVINSYCKIGDYIFIFKGFKHDENHVCIQFQDKDTPVGYTNYLNFDYWYLKHGKLHDDFDIAKYQFIVFKNNLEKLGLRIEINKIN